MLLMTSLSHSIGTATTLAQFLAGGSIIATGGFDELGFDEDFFEAGGDSTQAIASLRTKRFELRGQPHA
jgi:hypothetical protein